MGKWWSSTRELWRLCDLPVLIHLATTPQECQQCLGSLSKQDLWESCWDLALVGHLDLFHFLNLIPLWYPFQIIKVVKNDASDLRANYYFFLPFKSRTVSHFCNAFVKVWVPNLANTNIIRGSCCCVAFGATLYQVELPKIFPILLTTLHEHFCDPGCS